ncbi:TIGR02449 family protein [Pseudomonas sp. F1_0610]|uniref:TIGR02449 family protein n=1 Tax=Pseudomonas sp. F1_0610 TaxID=3114284 RepID=UPI0039C0F27C
MKDSEIKTLLSRVDQLISRYEELKQQHQLLKNAERTWREERAELIEKNQLARVKVEAMISRLKALEQDT